MRCEETIGVVLAAGLSTRFDGDKLIHPLNGRPLAAHVAATLASLPFKHRVAIVPAANPARTAIFKAADFDTITNPDPGRGLASSLIRAARHAIDIGAAGMVVCLADMPFITSAHLHALLDAIDADTEIVATKSGALRSPPAAFAATALPRLLTVGGDHGARDLIATAKTITAAQAMLMDFDRREDFSRA